MPPPIAYTNANMTLAVAGKNIVTANVVTSASATLLHNNMNGGSGPSAAILPAGWSSGDCPAHHNRGHLIGNHLGGPGNVANNLVGGSMLVGHARHGHRPSGGYRLRDGAGLLTPRRDHGDATQHVDSTKGFVRVNEPTNARLARWRCPDRGGG